MGIFWCSQRTDVKWFVIRVHSEHSSQRAKRVANKVSSYGIVRALRDKK